MNRKIIYEIVLTGLFAGGFTCQVSKPINTQTGWANIIDCLVSKLEEG